MISCASLEQPGRWRSWGIAAGLILAVAPALPLVIAAADVRWSLPDSVFVHSLARSLKVAGVVACLSLAAGLPAGVLAALYDFPLRRILLALLALPLLLPSFLMAIGLSMARIAMGLPSASLLSGFRGTSLCFATLGVPLVALIAFTAVRGISRSQVDAARLAGGERQVLRYTVRAVFPTAALTATLAAVLTLSDPGPGQILGYGGAASEVLTSFASQYDFEQATRQSLWVGLVVFVIGAPVAALLAPRLATGLLARDVSRAPVLRSQPMSTIVLAWLLCLLVVSIVLPLAGLAYPLLDDFPAARALQELQRTFVDTALYALNGTTVAVALGTVLALCAGRDAKLRTVLVLAALLLLCLPPSLNALGWIYSRNLASAQMSGVFAVCLLLGLRFSPLAALVMLRAVGTASPTWAQVAAVHGLAVHTYARKVLAPWLVVAAVPAGLLISFLAMADVTSVLLLHPPGRGSLPLAIYTIMANAPESLVGALCVVYVSAAATLIAMAAFALRRLES